MITLLKAIQSTVLLMQAELAHHLPIQTDQVLKALRTQMENIAKRMKKRAYKPLRTQASQIMNLLTHCMAFFSNEFSVPCIDVIAAMPSSKALNGLVFTRHEISNNMWMLKLLHHYHAHIDRACACGFVVD
jgi:hypothetical protein